MNWKYDDLAADQKAAIPLPLPHDWVFGGEPGGQIWPVFTCPVCGDECEREWGGCAHFKYVYDSDAGSYDYFNGTFFYEVAAKLEAMGHVETAVALEEQVNEDRLSFQPDQLAAGGEPAVGIKALYPDLVTVAFRVSDGERAWGQDAVFVP
jgi:hypothetical protein